MFERRAVISLYGERGVYGRCRATLPFLPSLCVGELQNINTESYTLGKVAEAPETHRHWLAVKTRFWRKTHSPMQGMEKHRPSAMASGMMPWMIEHAQ